MTALLQYFDVKLIVHFRHIYFLIRFSQFKSFIKEIFDWSKIDSISGQFCARDWRLKEVLGWAWSDRVDQKRGKKEEPRENHDYGDRALMKWKFINENATASLAILQLKQKLSAAK